MTDHGSHVLVVELRCLSCGDSSDITVATLSQLPRLPAKCSRCAGSVLAVSSASRVVRTMPLLSWQEGLRRRPGRPPGAITTGAASLPLFKEES